MTLSDMKEALRLLGPEEPPSITVTKEGTVRTLREKGLTKKQALTQWFRMKHASESERTKILVEWMALRPSRT